MIVEQLQNLLERVYDVPVVHTVANFLLTDRDKMSLLATHCDLPSGSHDAQDEQVLVHAANDVLEVTVFIDSQVLQRLDASNPCEQLNDANMADYCTALEGVSHFHYLTWRATYEHEVSLLELELQAEVDKYAAAMCLLTAQCNGAFPFALHERLFHRVRYRSELQGEALQRYQTANRGAARFCRALDERFLRGRRKQPEAWLRQLRQFYRLSYTQKMQCIAA